MASLEATLTQHAKSVQPAASQGIQDGALIEVPLDLLDDNPFQPRISMDSAELDDLANAIIAQGQLQAIRVRPKAEGRFIIVLGHRRVAAFKKLHASQPESVRAKYAKIRAEVKLALDDAELSAQGYMENVSRANLNPLEEALALERMIEKGQVKTTDELALLVGQPKRRVERLRRLAAGPKVIRDGVANGLMVVTGLNEDGKERKELRRVEFIMALSFLRLFDHLRKTKPKLAEERTGNAIRRALIGNWSIKRADEYVDGILEGRAESVDESEAAAGEEKPLVERTAKRITIDIGRVIAATDSQLEVAAEELRRAFREIRNGAAPAKAKVPASLP